MQIHVRVGRDVTRWLKEHPEHAEAFFEAVLRLRSNALTVIKYSEMVVHPGARFAQRAFSFKEFRAVFEWNHAEQKIHVHNIRKASSPPTAA